MASWTVVGHKSGTGDTGVRESYDHLDAVADVDDVLWDGLAADE